MAYLSIGSNVGDCVDNLVKAVERIALEDGIDIIAQGFIYETEPQGEKDQKWFMNTAVSIKTDIPPEKLLCRLKDIERSMGRQDGERWGPRVIDIDIIFYGDMTMETEKLSIPHPRAASRRFVLQPLVDIDPKLMSPVHGKTISQLLAVIPEKGQEIRKVRV